jgi:predicted transposase YdaD
MQDEFSMIIRREYGHGDEAMKNKSFLWELGFDVGLKKGENIGIKKGEENGVEKGKDIGIKYEQQIEKEVFRRSAVKMIKNGIPIEDIREYTGLPIDEIAVLKKKVENGEL